MNIIQDNYREKKQSNKTIIAIVVVMLILLVVAVLLLVLVRNLKSKTFKFYVDGVQNTSISENIFYDVDGTKYVNVKTISSLMGYEYNNGEYNNPYEEDKTKCYVKSQNEIASFISGTNKMYKVILKENDNQVTVKTGQENNSEGNTTQQITSQDIEYFEVGNEIKLIEGEIYAPIEAIEIGFNVALQYNSENNQTTIFTLPYLVKYYSKNISNSVLDATCDFSNKKLLLYDMVLVKNSDGEYGINKLDGEAVIGTKYAKIKFIESTQNFIITTQSGKQGIASTTETIISPQYDELKQLGTDLDLYLVKDKGNYGVIDKTGNTVIYLEYDQIGMDMSPYVNNGIDSQYIIYDKYIPVKKDGKWGLINTSGKVTLSVEYDSLGCTKGDSIVKSENNLLLVPELNGIVVCKENTYGLRTPEGGKTVPLALNEMYKTIQDGKTTYWMTFEDKTYNMLEWVQQRNAGQ